MGVSSTVRLPSLGAQSIPPLFSHLQHTSNAKVVSRWSITVRSFRAVPVPTNAWPSADQYDSDSHLRSTDQLSASNSANVASSTGYSQQAGSGSTSGGPTPSASGAPPLTKPRTMWQVWMSDFPGTVFVIVEDAGRSSRAKVWRDWELSMKKWKKQKRHEIKAGQKKDVQKQVSEIQQPSESNGDAKTKIDGSQPESDDKPDSAVKTGDTMDPMDVDTTASVSASNTTGAQPDKATSPPDTPSLPQQKDLDTATSSLEDDPVLIAGPAPPLRLPSHTRYTVSAFTSSMSSMLTSLNLPPPHGAPVGTAGPGAWVPRGAAVSIDGLVLEINSQSLNALPGISPALASVSTPDDADAGGVDWRVKVGSVMGGGGRSAGAIVEAEFLPVSTMLPTSKFMHEFLYSLFPAGLVPMPPSAPGLVDMRGAVASSLAGNGVGTPITNNAAVGPAPGAATNVAAPSTSANGTAGASYTIGGGAGAAQPNPNFNIPVISDQLWEEVVPRSGESWRQRIAKRSRQMKSAARMQRKKATAAASRQNGTKPHDAPTKSDDSTDAFGWYTFGSGIPAAHTADDDWRDDNEDLWSSDSESEAIIPAATLGVTGTAVTVQQAADDDDDDDDEDRPLGASVWSTANTRASDVAGPPSAVSAPVNKEDTVQLIFKGLRADEDEEPGEDGWNGIERGRRIAFQYVQMLRAEGII